MGLGDVVDQAGGHQRLEQADRGERQRVRQHDEERVQREGHRGDAEEGECAGQFTFVTDVRKIQPAGDCHAGEQHDRDQWSRDRRGDPRDGVDDHEAGGDERKAE